jgi:hypothetical protein
MSAVGAVTDSAQAGLAGNGLRFDQQTNLNEGAPIRAQKTCLLRNPPSVYLLPSPVGTDGSETLVQAFKEVPVPAL